jgi:hypothetical protein
MVCTCLCRRVFKSSSSLVDFTPRTGKACFNSLWRFSKSPVGRTPRIPISRPGIPITTCVPLSDTLYCLRNNALVAHGRLLDTAFGTGRRCKLRFNGGIRGRSTDTAFLVLLTFDPESCCIGCLQTSCNSYKSLGTTGIGLGTAACCTVGPVLDLPTYDCRLGTSTFALFTGESCSHAVFCIIILVVSFTCTRGFMEFVSRLVGAWYVLARAEFEIGVFGSHLQLVCVRLCSD